MTTETKSRKGIGGRPRTTINKLPENWKQIVLDCGREGGSDVEMRSLLGISQDAWETLLHDSKEFSVTIKEARTLCQVWWERIGRSMVTGEIQGNATSWIFNMKNRFKWRDATELNHKSSDGSMSPNGRTLADFYKDIHVQAESS